MAPPAVATHPGEPAHEQQHMAGERESTGAQAGTSGQAGIRKTTCDFTLLAACAWELRERWLPAKVEQARVLKLQCCFSHRHIEMILSNPGGPGG